MFSINVTSIRDNLASDFEILSFKGVLYQNIIQDMGEALEKELMQKNSITEKSYSLFSVFIEQTQNINNYISKKTNKGHSDWQSMNSSIVKISKTNDDYVVSSTNIVENCDISELFEKLELIKSKNADEIKQMYREQLKTKRKDMDSGAGLGLLEMAKRSSEPIQYSFLKKDEQFSYFTLNVTV